MSDDADFIVKTWTNPIDAEKHFVQLHRLRASGRVEVRYFGGWEPCADCQPPITPTTTHKEVQS